jgi:PAS domain S-box-containing protein
VRPEKGSRQSLAEAVVRDSPDGLAVLDREGRYALWNPTMERFTGKAATEVLGRNAFEVFPFLREHGLDRAIDRVLHGETVVTAGIEHHHGDGRRRFYDRLYRPLRSDGAITGVIAIIREADAFGEPEDEDVVYRVDMSATTFGALSELRSTRGAAWSAGDPCYRVLHGRSGPCPDCPLLQSPAIPWPRFAARRLASQPELYEVLSATPRGGHAQLRAHRLPDRMVSSIHEAKMNCLACDAKLTEREGQVLRYLAMGRSLGDIALILGIRPRTVKFHQTNLLEKVGADSRADLIRLVV